MNEMTLYVVLIAFLASVIRSAFGFGESLVAVPLLALFIPVDIAVPLSVLFSITIAAIVVAMDWEKIHFESAKRLILSSLFGIPLGILVLKYGDEVMIKVALGGIIIAFSLFSLRDIHRFELKRENRFSSYIFGFIAGILGGGYGMNGPPLVVYGSLRGWSPQHFRATLQAYFLAASSIGMMGYWSVGLWNETVTNYYLSSLIVLLPAVLVGKKLNNILPVSLFKKCIYISLIGIGLLLMFT